jgi:hypothetical protein
MLSVSVLYSLCCIVEQSRRENEELRRDLQDYHHMKSSFDGLRQDYEAVKLSLDSCERIRVQQKELIEVLQRAQAMLGLSHLGGVPLSTDVGSVTSFQSMSSISQTMGITSSAAHRDELASQTSSVLPTVLNNINHSLTLPKQVSIASQLPTGSAVSSIASRSPKHSDGLNREHSDW